MLAKPTKLWSPNEFSMSIPKATYRKEYGEYGLWYYNKNNNNNDNNTKISTVAYSRALRPFTIKCLKQ